MLSWLNPTAHPLPVYASQRRSPSVHATLGSGWLPALTGQDCVPAGFHRKVSSLRRRILPSQALPVASRAHNQYSAECTFGAEFMRDKREAARRKAAEARAHATAAGARATPVAEAAGQAYERDVIPWLRRLGFRMDEARSAAAR